MNQEVRILESDDVEEVLRIDDVIPALEQMYVDLSNAEAINSPRVDTLVPTPGPGDYYAFKTMFGSLPNQGVAALRINSDIIRWPEDDQGQRRVIVPTAPGDQWVGFIYLWDVADGTPLARMPEGNIQRMRVGATSAIAAEHLAREDATTMALLGSGHQAGGQLLAFNEVRDLKQVDVYSPTPENREAFAAEYDQCLDCTVTSVESAEQAVKNKDIINTATNSHVPTIDPEWLSSGVHVTTVKKPEASRELFAHADTPAIHISGELGLQHNHILHDGEFKSYKGTPWKGTDNWWNDEEFFNNLPELNEVVGDPTSYGRRSDEEITLFVNNLGMGLQFAACGAVVHKKARNAGLGTTVPVESYTQPYIT